MNNKALSILVVEDNPGDAVLLEELLNGTTEFIYNITHVEKLNTALDVIRQTAFDIVLSDLSLPDAQGLESIIRIHALAPELPLVVMTGLNDENIGLESLRQGAQDYLVKGQMQPELLIRTIRYAIERSQTQRILRQQSAAMTASMEGIAILNAKRKYIYVNQAFLKLYGKSQPDELIGMTLDTLYSNHRDTPLWQSIAPAIEQQSYWRGEVVSHHRDEISYQELLITGLSDGGFVCNVSDITDRKRAETEMLQALEREKELSELKSKFVSIVSHEFRTPLTMILSSAELLQKYGHLGPDEKNQARFNRIIGGVYRMTQLLNDVLIFNKAEAGQLSFKPMLLNVLEFCQGLIEEIQLQVVDSQKIIFSSQSSECTTYLLDEQLLRHILTNLIFNAVKYSPNNTDVLVSLFCESREIILRVADRGIGIPSSDLERLFTLFYRGSNVATIPGTGLGLAIVKQCVELHGGSIHVTTEVNQGTEFKITIPVTPGA